MNNIPLRSMIEPKSDQLNYDDFIPGPAGGTVQRVTVKDNPKADQPMSIFFDTWDRPWKPCKSMIKVLGAVWGEEWWNWSGQSAILFGDPTVSWAGKPAGGIRLQSASGIDKPVTVKITLTRGKRIDFTVQPMQGITQQPQQAEPQQQAAAQPEQPTKEQIAHCQKILEICQTMDELVAAWGKIPPAIKPFVETSKNAMKDQLSKAPEPEPEKPADDIGNF